MVCRNCGAELKPGVMYCLECGSYVDENEDSVQESTTNTVESSTDESPKVVVKKKRKYKVKLSLKDWLIYGGLLLVLIGSIAVIVITLINGSKKEEVIVPSQPTTTDVVKKDQNYTIDNYTIVVDKAYNSDVQNDMLYVSDDDNFTLNFQVTSDDFEKYLKDHTILEEELKNSHYDVINSFEKTSGSRTFVICNIKVNGVSKYLYITKINDKYSAMGIIEEIAADKWEEALPALDKVIGTIQFADEEPSADTEDNNTSTES